MNYFIVFLSTLQPEQADKLTQIIDWIATEYPEFEPQLKWKQPMFAYQGTFIIGFAPYKAHIAVAPEVKTMSLFKEKIEQAGYAQTDNTFKIKYTDTIDFVLLKEIIEFQKTDKAGHKKFWR